jgi:hypothetical protein
MADRRRRARTHSREAFICAALACATLAACASGCGEAGSSKRPRTSTPRPTSGAGATPGSASATTATVAAPPPPPTLTVRSPRSVHGAWRVVAWVHGQPAAWIAARANATLMRFDQRFTHLDLHSGVNDGGAGGWTYGDHITRREIHLVVAAVNGGFKLTYKDVGFVSGRRVAVPLKPGLASIVMYRDGVSDIGAWHEGVPSAGRPVLSVLQNQHLLVNNGEPAATVNGCLIACWGETIGSVTTVARSGIGITADGQIVWAAGEQLSPAGIAHALVVAGAVRAVELDINPFWVAGYLYVHRPSGPEPAPVVPGQHGIEGQLLQPANRDFLAVVANG